MLWIRNFYCSTPDHLPCQSLIRINPWTRKSLLKYHFESELRQSIPSPVAILQFPSLLYYSYYFVWDLIKIWVFPSGLCVALFSCLELLFVYFSWFFSCRFFLFLCYLLFFPPFFSFSLSLTLSSHMIPTSSKLTFGIFLINHLHSYKNDNFFEVKKEEFDCFHLTNLLFDKRF